MRAEAERRSPILLPSFSPHILRHTFCTRLCENVGDEVTLKIVQSIMGHASVVMTMDIYHDLTEQKKLEAFDSLRNKITLRLYFLPKILPKNSRFLIEKR